MEYLSEQKRHKDLEEKFTTFLEEAKPVEVEAVYPTISDVIEIFSSERVIVFDEDIDKCL